jgi:RNA polymerase sigma-70 factor, ECF subfamily
MKQDIDPKTIDIMRLASGDPQAFTDLFVSTRKTLVEYAANAFNKNTYLAEEAVQEVFAKLWNRPAVLGNVDVSLTAYMYRAVINKCIEIKRTKNYKNEAYNTFDKTVLELVSTEPTPVERFQEKEKAACMHQIINGLPVQQGKIVHRMYIEGKSQLEVAEELDTHVGYVKSGSSHGRRKVKAAIANDFPEMIPIRVAHQYTLAS